MQNHVSLNAYDFTIEQSGTEKRIIFIHGSASDYRTWSKSINKISSAFHSISYSRRYHWPNQKISKEQDYSMAQHVEDLISLIKYTTGEPINLVGHSYGALMCLELACQHPKLINKMVLMEPPAIRLFVSNQPKPIEILKLLFSRPKTAWSIIKLGATGLGPASKAAEKGDMDKVMELFGKAALGSETFKKMDSKRKEMVLENLAASEFTGSGFLPLDDEKLKKIQIPTLFLTGEKSPNFYSYLTDRLEELLPDSTREEVAQAAHIMHEDNVEEFVRIIKSFLK